ncbi:MAG: alpha-hydroxy-acid oxidizing protein [Brevinematales bacterium]|nr:alpha-hydroxy-acid oxidizing protein [Brevinematales bacterium]
MDIKGKTIAIIGGGLLQLPVIKTAKRLGLKTVVVDRNPLAPGVKEADFFIQASTLDAELTSDLLLNFDKEKQKIDAVLTVGTDASYTVALSAKKIGLPGITPETAIKATDKYEMRKALRNAKVPVPDFEIVDNYTKACEVMERMGTDCVIKPIKNMGARGVRRVFNLNDLKDAFELAMQYSQERKVLIEQYIDAPELSIDALIYNNEIFITGVADRIIEYDPYFVETGHIMPSQLSEDLISFAIDTFKKGIKAIGINIGAAKGDIKISHSGCYIGEIAARLSGGFMSTYTFPYSSGIDLMENIIYISLGLPPKNLTPTKNWVSIERAIISPPGIVYEIEDNSKNIKYLNDVFLDVKIKDKVYPPKNNLDKQGHIIVAAPTYEEAILASHQAIRSIRIKTSYEYEPDIYMPENQILDRARIKFNGKCAVCPDCDGQKCKGWMPGVGSLGNGNGFIKTIEKIRDIEIIPYYIHQNFKPDTRVNFLDLNIETPIFPAPITGAITNLGGAISELELARSIVKGANHSGTIGFLGDGATPTKYKISLKVILENFGMAVPIFKPRVDNSMILERIKSAEKAGALGVGIDIDAASFLTMEIKGQNTSTKSFEELKEIISSTKLPFVIKGILNPYDAELALKAGAKIIIVSNHGGRVSDSYITPIEALINVKKAIGNDALIIYDGGIRSGNDVYKVLALGADFAMIGRPVMIYATGGGSQGVRQYIDKITNELKKAMALTNIKNIKELKEKGKQNLKIPRDFGL